MSHTGLTTAALSMHEALNDPSSGTMSTRCPDDDTLSEDSLAAWRSVYKWTDDNEQPTNDAVRPTNDPTAPEFNRFEGEVFEAVSDDEDERNIVFEENIDPEVPQGFSIDQEIAAAHALPIQIAPGCIVADQQVASIAADTVQNTVQNVQAEVTDALRPSLNTLGYIASAEAPIVACSSVQDEQSAIIQPGTEPCNLDGEGSDTRNNRNTASSSFSDIAKQAFLELMSRKGERSRAFTPQKYINYSLVVKYGPDSVPPPRGYTKSERKIFVAKRRDIAKNFELIDNQLYKKNIIKGNPSKKVVRIEEALKAVEELHSISRHLGWQKTWYLVNTNTHGITEDNVKWLVRHCTHCRSNEASVMRAPLNPIVSYSPMERVQMDLVDLRKHPSGEYHWFVHLKDHFGKMSWAYPLEGKYSVPIAKILCDWMRFNGIPQMIQCDNGKEFKGAVIRLLKKRGVIMVNGRPRHPQSQGLVEQGNGIIKRKITKWKDEYNRTDWAESLDSICKAVSTVPCQGLPLKYTPHKAMYSSERRLEYDKLKIDYGMTEDELFAAIPLDEEA